ncbi:hypothetical protein Hanom_Chr00s180301g01831661 [Helianthus anomalus]
MLMLEVNGQTATSYWLHLSACWNLMVNGCQTSPASKLSFHKYHHLFMKI